MKLLKTFNEEQVSKDNMEQLVIRNSTRSVIFDDEGNIALIYCARFDYYEIPGGGIDDGESIIEGLRRETLEETGCCIKNIRELGYTREVRLGKQRLNISYGFVSDIDGEKGSPRFEQDEIDDGFEVVWVPLEKAISLIQSGEAGDVLYRKYIIQRGLLFLNTVKEQNNVN